MNGEHGRYRVTGSRAYRGHPPGSEFDAKIASTVEARAIRRGDIALLERVIPSIVSENLALPKGWPDIVSTARTNKRPVGGR